MRCYPALCTKEARVPPWPCYAYTPSTQARHIHGLGGSDLSSADRACRGETLRPKRRGLRHLDRGGGSILLQGRKEGGQNVGVTVSNVRLMLGLIPQGKCWISDSIFNYFFSSPFKEKGKISFSFRQFHTKYLRFQLEIWILSKYYWQSGWEKLLAVTNISSIYH